MGNTDSKVIKKKDSSSDLSYDENEEDDMDEMCNTFTNIPNEVKPRIKIGWKRLFKLIF